MNAFINKMLEKKIKKDHYLNKSQIFESLHNDVFFIKTTIDKKQIKKQKKIINNVRIKKKINNNKFNYRNKEQNVENIT